MSELLPFLLFLQPPAMESGDENGESRGSARTARNTRNPSSLSSFPSPAPPVRTRGSFPGGRRYLENPLAFLTPAGTAVELDRRCFVCPEFCRPAEGATDGPTRPTERT
jgi:hypothetical protein